MNEPLFNWLDHRAAGVLLHPTALPGEFGIGTFNDHCKRFLDFLAEAGFKYWQVCPLGPTGYGDSPYQSLSSFAGNPYLISFRSLHAQDLVQSEIFEDLSHLSNSFVDYGALYQYKWPLLEAIYETFAKGGERLQPYGSFTAFKKKNASWLEPFAYFQALKTHFDGSIWTKWPERYRSYGKAKGEPLEKELSRQVDAQKFYQYLFFGQWKEIRQYAKTKGVQIIGDIPIFVAMDSADVWQNPEYFLFDEDHTTPVAVAGCPPDYFSDDGQLWGNPLYNWEALKTNGYDWWIRRLRASFDMCDVVRIDHFRGFAAYWKIPYGSETARPGKWVEGPGLDFFKSLKKKMPNCRLIAEDLGELDDSVRELLRATGLPGMAILQFAFGGGGENYYLPHNLSPNTAVYPGSHDNDTAIGWYESRDERTRDHVRRYLSVSGENIAWDLIRCCYGSVAKLSIVPLQDLLSLESDARFNTPGQAQGNWQWRCTAQQLHSLEGKTAGYFKELSRLFYREGPQATAS